MKNIVLVWGVGLALIAGCTGYDKGESSIRFSWVMGESGQACADEVDQVEVNLTGEGGDILHDVSLPCSDGEATIGDLHLGSYHLALTGTCHAGDIGYQYDSRDTGALEVTREGVNDFGIITLEKISDVCDGSDCQPGEGAELLLATQPSPASAPADGIDAIRVQAVGQDQNCHPLAEGTDIEFRITDQDPTDPTHNPAGVGYFANDSNTIIVSYGAFGASTDIRGTTVGTAKVSAFCEDYNLTALPVDIEFTQPVVTGQCAVELKADPPVIAADGASTSTITATLTADAGGPLPDGTPVSFSTTHGIFTESGGPDHEAQTSGSAATATLQSEQSATSIRADVGAAFTCDDSQLHSDQMSVTFGAGDLPSIDLSASASEVLADDVSTVDLVAEVFLPGGAPAGAGEDVVFTTNLGRFVESGTQAYTASTDLDGTARATFVGGTQGGTATVSASVIIDSLPAYDELQINVIQLGFVEFVSAVPDKLGVKGSGVDESSLITFAVKDTLGNPFPAGALVEFEPSAAPGVTLDSPNDRTDSDGIVTATLNSGNAATVVTVTATAHVGTESIQAVSTPIAIVGAKPSARFMLFSCERYNIGGLELTFLETACTVQLADRYSYPIGFATNVIFRTEAGAMDASATTSEDAADLGEATAVIRTMAPDPKDVEPITDEPFIGSHNPRDGIVTIIAVAVGEEEFTDVNGDTVYNPGEPYVDTVEPFVDKDDDGVRDPDEPFVDSNNNLQYDGLNGQWDGDTLIWAQTHMLWTGNMEMGDPATDCGAQYRYSVLCPNTFNIAKGDDLEFIWEAKDINLNPLNQTTLVEASVAGKGSLGATTPLLPWTAPDTLGGFDDLQQYWVSCGGGFCGRITVSGAPLSDPDPAAAGSVSVDVSYYDSPGAGWQHTDTLSVDGTFQ